LHNLLVPALGEDIFTAYVEILNQCIVPTDAILKDPRSAWFRERSRAQLVAISLEEACAELANRFGKRTESWQWGKLHRLLMNHALGRVGVLRPLLAIGPMPATGDGMTVNLGFYRHSNPYGQTVGAALRFVADLKSLENSGFVLASGQSGHPLSRHYADQTPLWRTGQRLSISTESSATNQARLVLSTS
jgi:penicillin amidase